MKRLLVVPALVAALLVSVLLSACGGSSDSSSSTQAEGTSSSKEGSQSGSTVADKEGGGDEATVKTGVFPLDLYTAAEAGGLFKRGNVETVSIDSGPAALPLLESGSLDAISGIAPVPLATALGTGIDYKIVWVTNAQDPMRLVAKGIKSAEELKGQSVGLPIGSVAQFFFEKYLEENGMSPSDVNEVEVAPEAMPASFERGAIKAAYVWAPFWTQLVADGGTVIDEKDATEFLVVGSSFVEDHPEAVQNVVCDLAEIHGEFEKNPKPLYELLSKTTQQPVSELEEIYPQTNAGPAEQATPELLGTATQPSRLAKILEESAEWLKSKGQVPTAPSLEEFQEVFDPEFAANATAGKCS